MKTKGEVLATIPFDEETYRRWRRCFEYSESMIDAMHKLLEKEQWENLDRQERIWEEVRKLAADNGFNLGEAGPEGASAVEIDWILKAVVVRKAAVYE